MYYDFMAARLFAQPNEMNLFLLALSISHSISHSLSLSAHIWNIVFNMKCATATMLRRIFTKMLNFEYNNIKIDKSLYVMTYIALEFASECHHPFALIGRKRCLINAVTLPLSSHNPSSSSPPSQFDMYSVFTHSRPFQMEQQQQQQISCVITFSHPYVRAHANAYIFK